MPESSPVNTADSGHEVRTYFVRARNALVARASFSELYVDYYLHLSDQKIQVEPEHDAIFKRALAAFVLHCASRPWNEMIAWTIHFQKPFLNVFLTGDNSNGAVVGRVFTDNIREMERNVFYCDVVRPGQPKRRSAVNFEGADPITAVEAYYAKSEQRPARYFQIEEEEFVMVSAHPDCDQAWFDALTVDSVRKLDSSETLAILERRVYRWHCGCNQVRMMEVLAPTMKADPQALFEEQNAIEIRCPRCGARHVITRESMEAFIAAMDKPEASA
ncbi:MAG TPA: Hsp33 family molecular chaperone HslO [Opitutaceae bacterium]|nr:Hsp33 family molecular chaperone HslO [Opitutaceae bacterium]